MWRQKKSLTPCQYEFPDPSQAEEEGFLALGGDLSPSTLVEAYSRGVFPWPMESSGPVPWFSPDPRGVLFFSDFHIPKSFTKALRRSDWQVTYDRAFDQVVAECAVQARPGQEGTWIYSFMQEAYRDLFAQGYAHSVECWQGEQLVGGLYGVLTDRYFSAESMFYKESGASKFCLVKTVELLKELGHSWMDIQMVTPVTEAFGGSYIPRSDFLNLLKSD